jgi:hypothetical protein
MKTWIALGLAAIFLLTADSTFAQKQQKPKSEKVYRWVDEEGNVHYTETLPPDFKDKKTDVLDRQGLLRETDQSLVPPPPKPVAKKAPKKGELPRDKSGLQRPEPRYTDSEFQQQKDALLVLRYHSEEEILDALNVEVRQLAYDANLLTTSRSSLDTAYSGSLRELADRQRAGVALPPEDIKAIENMKRKMAANDLNMAEIKKREEQIREKFDAELERYRYLVAEANDEEAAE